MSKINHLVVDAPGFLKNVVLQDLSSNIYTVAEVVAEIRDKATRERLQVLPYKLHFKAPQVESIKFVGDFSKKTGDYFALSATDIRVLALTYELHVQNVGRDGIRTEPQIQVTAKKPWEITGLGDKQLPGFYNPAKDSGDEVITDGETFLGADEHCDTSDGESRDCGGDVDNEQEEEDEEEGWIAPDNFQDIVKKMGGMAMDEDQPIQVGCLTTDFAMQNTLIQMGLNVVSVDGMLIKQPKMFILRCHGCYKTTTKMDSKFCGHCGYKTLKRVAVTLDENGTKHVHINFSRPINVRGIRFNLPTPKGGQHAVNPWLCADQCGAQNRLTKLGRTKTNALDLDYVAETSPFAMNDIYSRSAMRKGQTKSNTSYHNRKNPNVVVKHFGNRRK